MKNLLKNLYYYIFVRKSKWNFLIICILIATLFIFIFFKQSPIKKGNYTIGLIYKKYWPIISYEWIDYYYFVNGKKYYGSSIYNGNDNPKISGRYLVQYSLEDYSYSDVKQNIPIPDSIKSVPHNGWKELPEWAKTNH